MAGCYSVWTPSVTNRPKKADTVKNYRQKPEMLLGRQACSQLILVCVFAYTNMAYKQLLLNFISNEH